MTLITQSDIETELQTTLPAGYTHVDDIIATAEDLLKLKTNRTSFTGSAANLAKLATLYLSIDRIVLSNRDLVKNAIDSITENGTQIKFNNGKTLQSYRMDAEQIIRSLRIPGAPHSGLYNFADTGDDAEMF